jgi:GAF domain-containing protein
MSDESKLASILTTVAVSLLTEPSLTERLRSLVRIAARLMPQCAGGSIAMLVDGRPTTLTFTDRIVLEVDLVRYDCGDGPRAIGTGSDTIRVAHLMQDERFPHFAIGAADQRILSTMSTPIRDAGHVVGTLDLYCRTLAGFNRADEDVALVIVAEAATIITASRVYAKADSARASIQADSDECAAMALAEGILMALYECSVHQATSLIKSAAQTTGSRLIDAARRIAQAIEPRRVDDL